MKYYVVNIETYNNETKESPAIYTYDTLDDAVASFHSRIGSAMKRDVVQHVLCTVIDSAGGIHKNESWERKTTSTS